MKKITFIFAITMMAAASNHTATAQNSYVDGPACISEPQVMLDNDTNVVTFAWISDEPISEVRYRTDDSLDWVGERPAQQPCFHFSMTLPLDRDHLEWMVLTGSNHFSTGCTTGVTHVTRRPSYGYQGNRRHPMW